jgi:hypothetical protein
MKSISIEPMKIHKHMHKHKHMHGKCKSPYNVKDKIQVKL